MLPPLPSQPDTTTSTLASSNHPKSASSSSSSSEEEEVGSFPLYDCPQQQSVITFAEQIHNSTSVIVSPEKKAGKEILSTSSEIPEEAAVVGSSGDSSEEKIDSYSSTKPSPDQLVDSSETKLDSTADALDPPVSQPKFTLLESTTEDKLSSEQVSYLGSRQIGSAPSKDLSESGSMSPDNDEGYDSLKPALDSFGRAPFWGRKQLLFRNWLPFAKQQHEWHSTI